MGSHKIKEDAEDCPDCGAVDNLTVIMSGPLTDFIECLVCGSTWGPEQQVRK